MLSAWLDHCDGELARATGRTSRFGHYFDYLAATLAYSALFLGAGETFQVWNPTLFLKDSRVPEDMKDIARFRLEERGLKA